MWTVLFFFYRYYAGAFGGAPGLGKGTGPVKTPPVKTSLTTARPHEGPVHCSEGRTRLSEEAHSGRLLVLQRASSEAHGVKAVRKEKAKDTQGGL